MAQNTTQTTNYQQIWTQPNPLRCRAEMSRHKENVQSTQDSDMGWCHAPKCVNRVHGKMTQE